MATLHLSVMGAFAEFDRTLILERQRTAPIRAGGPIRGYERTHTHSR
jgi:DNA invertase Pin-like site-specific DNA recombinase